MSEASLVSSAPMRYLYERLGADKFQLLCGALLVHAFPDVTCFPVGQPDGGRDARRRPRHRGSGAAPSEQLIYQVKWTSNAVRNPVAWLDAAIRAESDNITRLVHDGASEYYLLTNVAGTATRGRGSIDRIDERLEQYAQRFGVSMTCWWRADIDARVDSAPREITWAYADMLAGYDAIRYLIEADREHDRDASQRDLVLKVVAAQWQEDVRVKFKQVELDSYDLADLYVDVEAHRTAQPRIAGGLPQPHRDNEPRMLGGAAAYLLTTSRPLTIVRGEPGQGKSTLGQYLCQVHRAELLQRQDYLAGRQPELRTTAIRLPLRVDLRDYAAWLDGHDPFDGADAEIDSHVVGRSPTRRRRPRPGTVEAFLAALLSVRSGGRTVDVATVQDVLARFPMLIVLDGLDEVARESSRAQVVREIDQFSARLATDPITRPQVVVTTRPNSSGLPEPTPQTFETIALARLGPRLRTAYLRKWADVRGIRGRARRELQRIFDHRAVEPHIAQLADNPMQLTILLYLMQRRGDSVPTGRSTLYASYMETFLDREASKTPAVHRHRLDLEEVTAFLGWQLQSQAEADQGSGRLATAAIKSAINSYLYEAGKNTALVDDLFTAVTDRVWALSSKVSGTFEFDVQPVREYFAAQYLYRFARTTSPDLPRAALLRELMLRPYWLNSCRFYAGFANPNEISGLVDGVEDALGDPAGHTRQIRSAAWTLLGDGVFAARPRTQTRAAQLLTDDLSIRLINYGLDCGDLQPLPAGCGASAVIDLLTRQIENDPSASLSAERARLADRHTMDSEVRLWCRDRLAAAAGTSAEGGWLRVAAAVGAGRNLPADRINALSLDEWGSAAAALAAGIQPEPGSPAEQRLLRAVLDGRCSDASPSGVGTAADLLRLVAPQHLLRLADDGGAIFALPVGHLDNGITAQHRRSARHRLAAADGRLVRLAAAATFGKGQAGTTSPWGNTAREIARIFGPCWLAVEVAVIGAASPDSYRIGGDVTPGSALLGPHLDYGLLLQETRRHRSDAGWWIALSGQHTDPLSQATWILALLAVAAPHVVGDCLRQLQQAVAALTPEAYRPLVASSSRLGAWRLRRKLPAALLADVDPQSLPSVLLLAHHVADHNALDPLECLSDAVLSQLADPAVPAWPAHRAVSARLKHSGADPTLREALRRCGALAALDAAEIGQGLSRELAELVLADPTQHALGWLIAADQALARCHAPLPLVDVARQQCWFDDVSGT